MDLQQNAGPIFKQLVGIAHCNNQKGKNNLVPNASAAGCTAGRPRKSLYSKTACLATCQWQSFFQPLQNVKIYVTWILLMAIVTHFEAKNQSNTIRKLNKESMKIEKQK